MYQCTPKTHYFQHLPHQATLINPRYMQCYGEESAIGKATQTWWSCAEGPYAPTVQRSVLIKYLTALVVILDL